MDFPEITAAEMQETIKEYFKDFFKEMHFFELPFDAWRFAGYRNAYACDFVFKLDEWSKDVFFEMQYHRLEDIKGKCLKYEDTIYTA